MNKLAWNLIAFNLEHLIKAALENPNVKPREKLIEKLKAARKQLDTAIEFLEKNKERTY